LLRRARAGEVDAAQLALVLDAAELLARGWRGRVSLA